MIYTTCVCLLNVLICVVVSSIDCYKTKHDENLAYSLVEVLGIIQAGFVLIINPIIMALVLPSLYGKIGSLNPEARTMFIKIILIGITFEITIALRVTLLSK